MNYKRELILWLINYIRTKGKEEVFATSSFCGEKMRKIYSYKDIKVLLKNKKERDYSFVNEYIIKSTSGDIRQKFKIIILECGDMVDTIEVIDGYMGGLLRLKFSRIEYIDGYFIMHLSNVECVVIFNRSILNESYLRYFKDLIDEKEKYYISE